MANHGTALSFLKKGYQVIPLSRKTGNPIIKFKDREITEEIIKSVNWLNCDIALLMRGVWGIDIDTHKMDPVLAQGMKFLLRSQKADLLTILSTDQNDYGLDGYSSILKHERRDELVKNFNRTFLELTNSGGLHVLFRKREGITYNQKIGLMTSVDIKAHENNYIKIYPSAGREVLQSVDNLPFYEGEFEKEVFAPKQEIVTHYFSSNLPVSTSGSHEGKEAYDRVISGSSMNRNDDLFKAACWAFENQQDINALTVVIGTVKNCDVFTREEFEQTIESARRKVSYITIGT